MALQPSSAITGSDKRTSAMLTPFGAGSSEYEAASVVCGLLIAERIERCTPAALKQPLNSGTSLTCFFCLLRAPLNETLVITLNITHSSKHSTIVELPDEVSDRTDL